MNGHDDTVKRYQDLENDRKRREEMFDNIIRPKIPYHLKEIVAPSVRLILHRALLEIGNIESRRAEQKQKLRDLEQYQAKLDKNIVHYQRSNIRDQIATEIFESVLQNFT